MPFTKNVGNNVILLSNLNSKETAVGCGFFPPTYILKGKKGLLHINYGNINSHMHKFCLLFVFFNLLFNTCLAIHLDNLFFLSEIHLDNSGVGGCMYFPCTRFLSENL